LAPELPLLPPEPAAGTLSGKSEQAENVIKARMNASL
jgi:hypothetical protein